MRGVILQTKRVDNIGCESGLPLTLFWAVICVRSRCTLFAFVGTSYLDVWSIDVVLIHTEVVFNLVLLELLLNLGSELLLGSFT